MDIKIARNIALKEISRKKRELSLNELGDAGYDESIEERIESLVDLEKAFSILSEEERQIVILRIGSGLKHKQIAEILDLKPA